MNDDDFALALDDPRQAGVFFVTADDLTVLAATAQDADLLVRQIDLAGCEGKEPLLQRIAEALETPAEQGRNWDALGDQLRDLSWLPAQGYALLFAHADALRDAGEAAFDVLLDILDETTVDWQERNRPFWAFLALPDEDFPDAP